MGRTLCLFAVTVLAALRATGQVNTINTIAGGAPQPNVATSAYLPQPVSAVRDTSGNTYISVPALNTVYLVSTAGALSVYAGNGIAGFSGDGGPAAQAQLNFPEGLAIDSGKDPPSRCPDAHHHDRRRKRGPRLWQLQRRRWSSH